MRILWFLPVIDDVEIFSGDLILRNDQTHFKIPRIFLNPLFLLK